VRFVPQVTHLGYHKEEKDAAETYDIVSYHVHGETADLNFRHKLPETRMKAAQKLQGAKDRAEIQRRLGVQPMSKSSK
jgi:hypothetical protein